MVHMYIRVYVATYTVKAVLQTHENFFERYYFCIFALVLPVEFFLATCHVHVIASTTDELTAISLSNHQKPSRAVIDLRMGGGLFV